MGANARTLPSCPRRLRVHVPLLLFFCGPPAPLFPRSVPTCGSPGLLTTVLRDTFNFTGFVVSDYDAWANIVTTHNVSAGAYATA